LNAAKNRRILEQILDVILWKQCDLIAYLSANEGAGEYAYDLSTRTSFCKIMEN
jgi:hypothetical protein